MATDGTPRGEPAASADIASLQRHRPVPSRVVGNTVIAARPRDGVPVTMNSAAALAWRELDDWTTPVAIDARLADAFPEVPAEERMAALDEILNTLWNDEFLERR